MEGALAGALAMFLVTVGALGWMQFRGVNFTERLFGAGVQADAGTEQKLQTLKNLIDEEYLYSDEVEEDTLRKAFIPDTSMRWATRIPCTMTKRRHRA